MKVTSMANNRTTVKYRNRFLGLLSASVKEAIKEGKITLGKLNK